MAALSIEQHDRVKSVIFRNETIDRRGVENPKAIVLAGQPGAGKSGLALDSINAPEFKDNHVRIDIDELRNYHSQYRDLQKTEPKNAATLVQKDAGQWGKELRAHCIEQRYNVVIDGTLGNAAGTDKLINQLKEAGYDIEVHVLALDKERSDQGIFSRYENGLERGSPRWVEPDTTAQKAYDGIPHSVQTIEQKHSEVPIKYYGVQVDENGQRVTTQLDKPAQMSGKELVEAHRNRDWTPSEKLAYVTISDSIVDKIQTRNGSQQDLREAQQFLKGERYQSARKDLALDQGKKAERGAETSSQKSAEELVKQDNKQAKVFQARSGNFEGRITHITENEVVQQVKPNAYYVHQLDAKAHNLKVNHEVKITNNKGKTTIKNLSLERGQAKANSMAKSPQKSFER